MSLIVAVHNGSDIVIAWDRQSRYSQAGRSIVPPEEAKKVTKVNDQLALMVTGSYNSDKLVMLADFREHRVRASLDEAFTALYDLGDKMVLRPNEPGLMVGLAGYSGGKPTFRLIQRIYGDPNLGYVTDYPLNYYLSGDEGPVATAEARVQRDGLTMPLPTPDIEGTLKAIVGDCIEQYPSVLAGPVELLTLASS